MESGARDPSLATLLSLSILPSDAQPSRLAPFLEGLDVRDDHTTRLEHTTHILDPLRAATRLVRFHLSYTSLAYATAVRAGAHTCIQCGRPLNPPPPPPSSSPPAGVVKWSTSCPTRPSPPNARSSLSRATL